MSKINLVSKIYKPNKNYSLKDLREISKELRKILLNITTKAGSGHPTSSLSAVELITVLIFKEYLHSNLEDFNSLDNDRLIFSKGHASPLFYAIYSLLGKISFQEVLTYRQFNSNLEGHPTKNFKFTEVSTGSLGNGLGVGLGQILAGKIYQKNYKTFVLLGDSELAEGSIWEAVELAGYYRTKNLIALVDINSLGQRGITMNEYNLEKYKNIFMSFDWETQVIDGHNFTKIEESLLTTINSKNFKPKVILAKTIKGKGISFLENKINWHGKTLDYNNLKLALKELE